jgi:CBS domain-containing protein
MLTAKDIMTKAVISVTPETTVKDLAKILTDNNISGAPVVDDHGIVTAVVTESDLIDQSKRLHIPTVITILDSFVYLENPDKMEEEVKKMVGTTVANICSDSLKTVTPEISLEEVATIMAEKNMHTLPVLDGDKLVGVIGKKDIIKTLLD